MTRHRIAVGGFQHETNTFAPDQADIQAFAGPGDRPPLTRGEAIFEAFADNNWPIAGAIETLWASGHRLLPLTWAEATPSAQVTEDAYERIVGMLIEDLNQAMPVDGVYLDLHGAMVAEHLEDGEGEVLRRVRAVVGPDRPVVASLDLHANVTPEMFETADALVAYRHYPHIDMAETGGRAAVVLDALLNGRALHKAYRQVPFLIPINTGCTLTEPARSAYEELNRQLGDTVLSASFAPGFPAADIHHCGPSLFAYGTTPEAAEVAVQRMHDWILGHENAFQVELYSADEAVAQAIEISSRTDRPVVLADTQDNPGGGGNGDTVWLLDAMIRQQAQGAVVACIYDPGTAASAHAAGTGADIDVLLGAGSAQPGHKPYEGRFRVAALGDGQFTATGPMWGGTRMDLGPMALLAQGGVRVIVSSHKAQVGDQAILRHLGVEPGEQKIIALKSSVHFRADFQPIASEILIVAAPGPVEADPARLTWTRLREGIRLSPNGPVNRR